MVSTLDNFPQQITVTLTGGGLENFRSNLSCPLSDMGCNPWDSYFVLKVKIQFPLEKSSLDIKQDPPSTKAEYTSK